jgi:hypothetical protein
LKTPTEGTVHVNWLFNPYDEIRLFGAIKNFKKESSFFTGQETRSRPLGIGRDEAAALDAMDDCA